ncbi:hypothetical protein N4G70_11305 [Streptomyces sp. ASQP_92]|uniref:hypothetical protein n=1 Tax=Streptomyces sp. ASQP_92 TaxID=2979116 RepID=UPI0021C1E5D8|nr:hypothetical protein [Streptomyces sp. ASQP_92]MCT9089457.1 hypothetical protein [Streptomyces sp. ASQP_92]
MESKSGAGAVQFEYVTYTVKPERCPACHQPVPLHLPARRGTLARWNGPPRVAYWHPRCAEAHETPL